MLLGDEDNLTTFELDASRVNGVLAAVKAGLQREAKIIVAYLHGSFLGEAPSHDVDVAALFQEGTPEKDRLDICLSLSSHLSYQTGVPIDVHALDPDNLALCFDALNGLPVLVRDEQKRSRFEERTIALYMDFRPIMRQVLHDLAEDSHR